MSALEVPMGEPLMVGYGEPLDLSNNENPLGASPAVARALAGRLAHLHRYPDDRGDELRRALAAHHALESGQVILGNGSNELIDLAARVSLRGGGAGVTVTPSFGPYRRVITRYGGQLVAVPLEHLQFDLERLAAAVDAQTRILFIAAPNNPTGSAPERAGLLDLLQRMPPTVLVVLDQAYAEYLPAEQQLDYAALLARHPNLLVLRSFSKAYGLAALRIGYGLGDCGMISRLDGERPTFNTNALAQAAAVAALGDQAHIRRVVAENRRAMTVLGSRLRELGIVHHPSAANFLLVEVGDGEGVATELLRRGIKVKTLTGFGLPHHIRLSTAPEARMAWVAGQLAAAIRETHTVVPCGA